MPGESDFGQSLKEEQESPWCKNCPPPTPTQDSAQCRDKSEVGMGYRDGVVGYSS